MYEAGDNSAKWGIVESRKARYHYGITIAEPFRPGIHPPHKLYHDPFFGIPMCSGRMKWLVRKVGYLVLRHLSPADKTERERTCIKASESAMTSIAAAPS